MENGPYANGISLGPRSSGPSAHPPTDNGETFSAHKRSLSGSIMSRLSFLRPATEESGKSTDIGEELEASPGKDGDHEPTSPTSPKKSVGRAMAATMAQQKTRKRKGSLRKAALLGRGAQRQSREIKASSLDTTQAAGYNESDPMSPTSPEEGDIEPSLFTLEASDMTPRPSMEGYASRANNNVLPLRADILPSSSEPLLTSPPIPATSPTLTYTSTTDEDEILSMPVIHSAAPPLRNDSSASNSYFPPQPVAESQLQRRRSQLSGKPTSPLSIGALASSHSPSFPAADASNWDYSETEWWGWVILVMTWVVFVVGMGSCLGVWSWAWDVGETPYAPPELEDDPTLPIVGYYPALMILTGVMAWVWVVVAWVGMKYFRHAKISGD